MSLPILYSFLNEAQLKGCFSLQSADLIFKTSNILSKTCDEKQIESAIAIYSEACNFVQMSGIMELTLEQSIKIYTLLHKLLEEKQNELKISKDQKEIEKNLESIPKIVEESKNNIKQQINEAKQKFETK